MTFATGGIPHTGPRHKGIFEGHSVASLEAQMVKNPSDRNFPPTYRYLCPFPLKLQGAPFLSLRAAQHSSSPGPRPHSLLLATGAVVERSVLSLWCCREARTMVTTWASVHSFGTLGLGAGSVATLPGQSSHSSQVLPRPSGPTGAGIPSLGGGLWPRG